MPLNDNFRLRCDSSFKARLKTVAKKKHRSMSSYTLYTLERHVEQEEAIIKKEIGVAAWAEALEIARAEIEKEKTARLQIGKKRKK